MIEEHNQQLKKTPQRCMEPTFKIKSKKSNSMTSGMKTKRQHHVDAKPPVYFDYDKAKKQAAHNTKLYGLDDIYYDGHKYNFDEVQPSKIKKVKPKNVSNMKPPTTGFTPAQEARFKVMLQDYLLQPAPDWGESCNAVDEDDLSFMIQTSPDPSDLSSPDEVVDEATRPNVRTFERSVSYTHTPKRSPISPGHLVRTLAASVLECHVWVVHIRSASTTRHYTEGPRLSQSVDTRQEGRSGCRTGITYRGYVVCSC